MGTRTVTDPPVTGMPHEPLRQRCCAPAGPKVSSQARMRRRVLRLLRWLGITYKFSG